MKLREKIEAVRKGKDNERGIIRAAKSYLTKYMKGDTSRPDKILGRIMDCDPSMVNKIKNDKRELSRDRALKLLDHFLPYKQTEN